MHLLCKPTLRSRILLLIAFCLVFIFLSIISRSHGGRHLHDLDIGTWLAVSLYGSRSEKEVPMATVGYLPILEPDCQSLIRGDTQEVQYVQEMLFKEFRTAISDEGLIELTSNCSHFTHTMKYPNMPYSKEEENYPIAYILTVHKNSEQVEKLLKAIYAPQNVYCIHIDSKAAKSFHTAISSIAACLPNVMLATKMEDIVYAGISRLRADLHCMRDLVSVSSKWNYVINLCGQDFPLATNLDIVRRLKSLQGKNDIAGVAPSDQLHIKRFTFKHNVVTNKYGQREMNNTKTLKSPAPGKITIYFGNAYNLFSRAFVEYVLNDSFAKELLLWMEDVYSPDEYYWTTLQYLPQTPGGSTVPSWASWARVIKWKWLAPHHYPDCQGWYQRGVCVYGVGDLHWLVSRSALFANKFDITTDHVVVQCLEQLLTDKVKLRQQTFTTFHSNSTFSILTSRQNTNSIMQISPISER